MKLSQRISALLLSMVMVLTFMPALAFADSGQAAGSGSAKGAQAVNAAAKPTKMTFTLGDPAKPLNGFVGAEEVNINQEGNKIVFKYSNGSSKTYKCVKNKNGYYRYYLNGNTSKAKLNVDELYAAREDGALQEGDNDGYLYYWYNDDNYVRTKVNIVGVSDSKVKSISYRQTNPISVTWAKTLSEPLEWQYEDKNFMGDELVVTEEVSGTEITDTYIYQEDPEEKGYYTYNCYSYDPEYEEYTVKYKELNFAPEIAYERWLPGKTYKVGVYYRGVKAADDLQITVTSKYSVPNEVVFNPANGFEPSFFIGESEFWSEPFAAEGCEDSSFTVKYSDGSEKTYIAKKHPTYGYYSYFLDGDTSKESFECYAAVKGGLKQGANDVIFSYEKYISKMDEWAIVDFTATVNANKYSISTNDKSYKYTGKYITPTFVVKNSVGKTLTAGTKATEDTPATGDYYIDFVPQKAIGIYTAQIVFNDGMEERELYPDSEEAIYRIAPPKAPVIKSVKGGSKSLTVKWTKFTAAQRKLIDGFYIEVATNKTFTNNYKMVKVGKTAASKTIKGLKKGKKYYVRMCAYKNVKPEGANRKFPVYSSNSKRKYAKTK